MMISSQKKKEREEVEKGVYTTIYERSQVDIRFINVLRFLPLSSIYKVKRLFDLLLIKCQT